MSCQMSVRKKSDNSEGRIQNCCMIQLSNKESLLRLVILSPAWYQQLPTLDILVLLFREISVTSATLYNIA